MIVQSAAFQHGAGDFEQAIANGAQAEGMAVTARSERIRI